MVKLQIDLSEEENKILEIYKAVMEYDSKEEATKGLIMGQKSLLKINRTKEDEIIEEKRTIQDL